MSRPRQPISTSSEWTFELIEAYDKAISGIAKDYGLDTYPNQIEIISSEQMIDAYSNIGMPLSYNHWSFGKQFVNVEKSYKQGHMGLAYELVINSNPCISYLLEENTMMMQALVIAHACYGHNSFFKNNYLFKTWTSADSIIDYLVFAKKYIAECEEKYGLDAVEDTLDACHALMNHGVDRYKRPPAISPEEERLLLKNRQAHLEMEMNDLWRTIPNQSNEDVADDKKHFPSEPQENLLYFIEKNAPMLEPWQREVVRIVRKIAQYFYPQKQTKAMNEGWATFWHYTIINDLYDEGLVTDEFMLEFLQQHTNVILQPDFDSPFYNGINPYTLGFNMMQDIKRICQSPTAEDKLWFPDIAGSNWLKTLDFAMCNFKDESFIAQYLSPKVIRDLKLFSILDDEKKDALFISAIHNEDGYQYTRDILSQQYNIGHLDPDIQIMDVNIYGDRTLTLHHNMHDTRPLSRQDCNEVLKHLYRLWQFPVVLESINTAKKVEATYRCPEVVNNRPIIPGL